MDPALGWEVVERQELIDVADDLLDGLGPFRAGGAPEVPTTFGSGA
ncbi:hypothetical protein [Streptomyces sp. NPDC087539]